MSSLGKHWAQYHRTLNVRVSASTYLILKARAQGRGVSLAVVAREALETALKART